MLLTLQELAILTEITKQAGKIIMKFFDSDIGNVDKKSDGSPVTAADKIAEKHIIAMLKDNWPYIACVGEESYEQGYRIPDTYWLIDPLDGTYEFINKRDEFTVNIALVHNCRPMAGVIYAPAKKLIYSGIVGIGAYKGKNQRLPCESCGETVIAESRSHSSKEEAEFIKSMGNPKIIRLGSSLKFCLAAEGSVSIYPRYNPTMHWDTAAGHAILKASGGNVIEWHTQKELEYGTNSMENPPFIALAPGICL